LADVQRPAPLEASSQGEPGSTRLDGATHHERVSDDNLDLGQYLETIRRHRVLLVLGTLVGAAAGLTLASVRPVLYEAVTTLIVLSPSGPDSRANAGTYRAALENLTLASQVVEELGLNRPPANVSAQRFLTNAVEVQESTGTNLVRLRVRLEDPAQAAEAARRLAHKAVALNDEVNRREGASLRDELRTHLDAAAERRESAEERLLAYQREAQVDLLKRDTEAMLDERGEVLKLLIAIEGERARLATAEEELAKQQPLLSVGRAVQAEEALRRAALAAESREARPRPPGESSTSALQETGRLLDTDPLDLSNPFVNPIYQTLEFQIATSRARLAWLEGQRREMLEVQKLGGSELRELTSLYERELQLVRLQQDYELAQNVYGDVALKYERARTDVLGTMPRLQIVDEAIEPDRPLSRGRLRWLGLGLAVGLFLAASAAVVRDADRSRPSHRAL
jgi:polysaccharide biosynthesis transport protein